MWRRLLHVTGVYVFICCEWIDALPADSEVSEQCPPLVDQSLYISCQLNNQRVDCDKHMTAGTKAVVTCNTYYTQFQELSKYDTTCQSDGKWSRPIHPCIPRCGETKQFPTFSVEILRGYHYWWYLPMKTKEPPVEFPWHVGIYRKIQGKYVLNCGGTIVSERAIITVANCFWDLESNEEKSEKIFKIAAGKENNDWFTDGPFVQKREIDKIILHPRYRGAVANWMYDISVVKLKQPLIFSNEIRPICIDFAKDFERFFTPGKMGVVVGWGGNQTEPYSKKLRKIALPYVDIEECERQTPSGFHAFLTDDKFCAGYTNGSSVCPGDGGGGFATKLRDGKWYLMGIVSIGVPPADESICNVFTYTTYTRVSSYYDFIRPLV